MLDLPEDIWSGRQSHGHVSKYNCLDTTAQQGTEGGEPRAVLITGAAGEMGTALVEALLSAGWRVGAADRDAAGLSKLGGVLGSSQGTGRFFPIVVDLATEKGCAAAVFSTFTYFGRIDAVVNHAAIGSAVIREGLRQSANELTATAWDQLFAVNLRAAVLVTRAALCFLERQKWGRIITIAPSAGEGRAALPLTAAMAALEAMWAVWAGELKHQRITMNVVARGELTDVAAPALWLLSDEATHVTGQFIEADAWNVNLRGLQAARCAARPLASADDMNGSLLSRPGPVAHLPAGADLAMSLSRALDSALPGARLTSLRDPQARRLKRA